MNQYVLAADLGGTNLRMAAIDRDGRILYQTKRPTPRDASAATIVEILAASAQECRANVADGATAIAFAAAVPSGIDYAKGRLIKAPNLPCLNDFPLADAMREVLQLPVLLENDANAATIGESWIGGAKGYGNAIMLTIGTGVGAGIVLDGRIFRGIDGMAGEVGHVCIEPNGVPCGCGSSGCVEQYTSATAIVRQARELVSEFPDSVLANGETLSSSDVYDAGVAGDALALEVFRKMGFYMGLAIGGLINTLNPEVVVIGGGAAAGWDLFIPHLRAQVAACAFAKSVERAAIVPATLGDDAGILGVAKLAFEETKTAAMPVGVK